jgi:hypothetical protein
MNRDKLTQKAAVAAEILGYSVEKTQRFLERRALAALPISELPIRLPDLDIDAVERIGTDLIRIDLKRGRTFFGHRSE